MFSIKEQLDLSRWRVGQTEFPKNIENSFLCRGLAMDGQLLQNYTADIQKLVEAENFKLLFTQLKKPILINNLLLSCKEHLILPSLMKANVPEKQGNFFKLVLLLCLEVGRFRRDYFFTTCAAHFSNLESKTTKLKYIAEPLKVAIGEIPRYSNWKLDVVLRVLNRRFDSIPLDSVFDYERLSDDVIDNLESNTFPDLFDMYDDFIKFYSLLVPTFLVPIDDYHEGCHKVLRLHSIRLLGYPLVYLHYHYTKPKVITRKDGRIIVIRRLTKAGNMIRKLVDILELVGNSTDYYLRLLEEDIDWSKRDVSELVDYSSPPMELRHPGQPIDTKLNLESVLNYFYLIYCENLGTRQRNFVVSPKYVFETCLNLFNYLLDDTCNYFESMYKTLRLVNVLTEELCDSYQLTNEHLDTDTFRIFLKNIIKVTNNFPSQEIRRLGEEALRKISFAFDLNGRRGLVRCSIHLS